MPIDYPNGQAWPPAEQAALRPFWDEYGAWYSGRPEQLYRYYNGAANVPFVRPSQMAHGLIGTLARVFWGRPMTTGQSTTHLHIPAAGDISRMSADLLFGDRPDFTVGAGDGESTATQDRLEEILEDGGVYAVLAEAAERASAFGGAYLRAQIDVALAETPRVDVVLPANAVPEWWCGVLRAVTFWRQVSPPDTTAVFRHLERHEVINGAGYVFHALYAGTPDRLGSVRPLADHPDTVRFAALVDATGGIPTGIDLLDVAYLPNLRPNPDVVGSYEGCSDYQSATDPMNALDETWSSWMRDLRLAKARILVPKEYLRNLGPGRGATFNAEQEIFEAVSGIDPKQPLQISPQQFAIRVDEHSRTAGELWKTIMRRAGLSANAFGEEGGGPAITAKEVGGRKERTSSTRQRKITYAKPATKHIARVLLALDVAHFGTAGVVAQPVAIEWPDAAAPDQETLARTLQLLDAAAAVSTQTKVEMLHVDWSAADIATEVGRIEAAHAPPAPLVDPGTFTGDTGPVPPAPADQVPVGVGSGA